MNKKENEVIKQKQLYGKRLDKINDLKMEGVHLTLPPHIFPSM